MNGPAPTSDCSFYSDSDKNTYTSITLKNPKDPFISGLTIFKDIFYSSY